MMKVLMKKNLGSRTSAALGLDYKKCAAGSEVVASDGVAETLVRMRLATLVDEPVKAEPVKPEPIKAVPTHPVAAKPVASMKGK